MASDDTSVWFITGCSTGFGHEVARAVLKLTCGKLHELRTNFDPWKDATLGADHPEHRKGLRR